MLARTTTDANEFLQERCAAKILPGRRPHASNIHLYNDLTAKANGISHQPGLTGPRIDFARHDLLFQDISTIRGRTDPAQHGWTYSDCRGHDIKRLSEPSLQLLLRTAAPGALALLKLPAFQPASAPR